MGLQVLHSKFGVAVVLAVRQQVVMLLLLLKPKVVAEQGAVMLKFSRV